MKKDWLCPIPSRYQSSFVLESWYSFQSLLWQFYVDLKALHRHKEEEIKEHQRHNSFLFIQTEKKYILPPNMQFLHSKLRLSYLLRGM